MNITITLTADSNFLSALQMIAGALTGKVVTAPAPVKEDKAKKATAAAPAPEETPAQNGTETTTTAAGIKKETEGKQNGIVTLEAIRELVVAKSKEKRGEVKELLTKFGADKVANLAKEHYADFFTQVSAL